MHSQRTVIIALIVIGSLSAMLIFTGFSTALDNKLMDGDCYMWLMRAKHLWATGQWYSPVVLATNAPYGEILHWTRPFDLLLLGGSILGSLFVDFELALWIWGIAISPALLLLSIPVLSWGTRPILSGGQFVFGSFLILLLWKTCLTFAPARPDHHSLLGFLFIVVLSCLLRLTVSADCNWIAFAAGAAVGLSLWVSVEALILLVYSLTVLVILWILGWHRETSQLMHFLVAVLGVLTISVGIQYPSTEWLSERYTQLAAPHVWLALSLAFAGLIVTLRQNHFVSWKSRSSVCVVAGLFVYLTVACLYPSFFLGPWVDYDSKLIKEWLPTISEYEPALSFNLRGIALFVIESGPVLIALMWCFFVSPEEQRQKVALVLSIGIIFYLTLSLTAGRWLYYAQLLSITPWVLFISSAWNRAGKLSHITVRIPARLGVIFFLIFGPLIIGSSVLAFSPMTQNNPIKSCDWIAMAAYLKDHAPTNSIVMTHTFKGPELAWWGNVRVVGSPYGHKNISDTWSFFRTTDNLLSQRIIELREIEYVLICSADSESINLGANQHESLYSRLQNDNNPDWLKPVRLPEDLEEFKLFQTSL